MGKKCALWLNVHSKDDTPFDLRLSCGEHIAQYLQYCNWVSHFTNSVNLGGIPATRDIILDLQKICFVACQETTSTVRVVTSNSLVVRHHELKVDSVCCFTCVYLFIFVGSCFFLLELMDYSVLKPYQSKKVTC